MKTVFNVGLLILTVYSVIGQNCQTSLTEANRAYYNGQLQQVSQLLEPCLNSEGFDKTDRIAALKLMVDTKLLQNQDEQADQYLKEFLTLNPTYKPREDELAEFRKLYSTYILKTKYSFGFLSGVLIPDYVIMRHHSYAGRSEQPIDYTENTGFNIGFTGDIRLIYDFYFSTSILFSYRSFKQEEIILDYQKVASHEKEYYLDIPLQIRYVFDLSPIRPFIGFGYAVHYLTKAEGAIDHLPLVPEFKTDIGIPISADSYDLTRQRNRFGHNWLASAGLQYTLKKLLIEFRFSYQRGLNNLIKTDERHSNRELLDLYAYVPDDYKVNSFSFSLTLQKNVILPFKKLP